MNEGRRERKVHTPDPYAATKIPKIVRLHHPAGKEGGPTSLSGTENFLDQTKRQSDPTRKSFAADLPVENSLLDKNWDFEIWEVVSRAAECALLGFVWKIAVLWDITESSSVMTRPLGGVHVGSYLDFPCTVHLHASTSRRLRPELEGPDRYGREHLGRVRVHALLGPMEPWRCRCRPMDSARGQKTEIDPAPLLGNWAMDFLQRLLGHAATAMPPR